jgi:hypothetical protein
MEDEPCCNLGDTEKGLDERDKEFLEKFDKKIHQRLREIAQKQPG